MTMALSLYLLHNSVSKIAPKVNTLNIMVLDNGRFHHAKSLVIPDNGVLIFLPPYSPELNPIERLWQAIKQKLFSHLSDIRPNATAVKRHSWHLYQGRYG